MVQFKPAQVIMLPKDRDLYKSLSTPKPIGNVIFEDTLFPGIRYTEMSAYWGSIYHKRILLYHLYIISDDEIKEGDWYLDIVTNKIKQAKISNQDCGIFRNWKKIIATTDTSLIKKNDCNCGATTYEGCSQCLEILPQPSEQFITKYIEFYNKGNKIEDVLVEYEKSAYKGWIKTGEAQPKYKIKVNPKDNTITIKRIKDSWNREEVVQLLNKLNNTLNIGSDLTLEQWIEKNI